MRTRLIKISLITAAAVLFTAFFSYEKGWIGGDVSCCHANKVSAQERPKEEEEPNGNPNHDPNKAECATIPKDDKGMIACQCHKWRKCDSGQEPKSCSNFCFKAKCKCSSPCV